MAWKYRCAGCDCSLDPAEGRLCDECRKIEKIRPSDPKKGDPDGERRTISYEPADRVRKLEGVAEDETSD